MTVVIYMSTLIGLIWPKSRVAVWIETMAMSLLYGGYNGHIDLDNYVWQYDNNWVINSIVQKWYSYLSVAFHKAGISFEIFHFIITVMSLIIIAFIASRLTEQVAYVLSLISVFVYIENGWQLKTMLATCVITIALYWYYTKIYGKSYRSIAVMKNTLIYVMLIYVAVQFHFLAIFFLTFLFIPFIKGHIVRVIFIDCVFGTVIGFVMTYAAKYIGMFAQYLSPISWAVFLVTFLWQIVGYSLFAYRSGDSIQRGDNKLQRFVFDGTTMLLFLLPFYYYANVATRIYRIWIIFMVIYASTLPKERLRMNARRLFFDAYIFGSRIFWFYILFMCMGKEPVIIDLFKNNYFF